MWAVLQSDACGKMYGCDTVFLLEYAKKIQIRSCGVEGVIQGVEDWDLMR